MHLISFSGKSVWGRAGSAVDVHSLMTFKLGLMTNMPWSHDNFLKAVIGTSIAKSSQIPMFVG